MRCLFFLLLILATPIRASEAIEIQRQNESDPTAAEIRDQTLIEAIKTTVAKGDTAAASGNQTEALAHYRTALARLEKDFLNISSYDIRFGISLVAPRIAETYAQTNDPRTLPAFERLNLWSTCGLMASVGTKPYQDRLRELGLTRTPRTDGTECADALTFALFRD